VKQIEVFLMAAVAFFGFVARGGSEKLRTNPTLKWWLMLLLLVERLSLLMYRAC
jgi:hypothetical protein